MIRGTTPTLQFEIPYTADLIVGGYITKNKLFNASTI